MSMCKTSRIITALDLEDGENRFKILEEKPGEGSNAIAKNHLHTRVELIYDQQVKEIEKNVT